MTVQYSVRNQENDAIHDEHCLWKEYWKTTPKKRGLTKGKLIEFYLPLVVSIVERLSIRVKERVEKNELLSAGVLGLHDAISNYSEEKGKFFAAFARKRIHGSIIDELRSQDHLTRSQRKNYREICGVIKRLTQSFSRTPTIQEIADENNMTAREVEQYIGMGSNSVKLDEQYENGLRYIDLIEDHKTTSPIDAADRAIAMEEMRDAYRLLNTRDQQLLYLRHQEQMKVKEISEIMGISEGRISQIYKEIILKLRVLLKIDVTP